MLPNISKIALIAAPAIGGLFVFSMTVVPASSVGTPSHAALQAAAPEHWTGFSAMLERTTDKGKTIVGRYYQATDGSTRYETGSALKAINMIGINNIGRVTSYHWSEVQGWTSQPMELPATGWRPRTPAAGLYTPSPDIVEGFQTVTLQSEKATSWLAPDLNYFPVKEVFYNCGSPGATCYARFYDITIGEPPAALFVPPDEVAVAPLTEPGGIIRYKGR